MPQGGSSLIAHRWQPITDLPDDWPSLCRPDLHRVHEQWTAARDRMADPEPVRQMQERLMTVWAIETGIIERLYSVDRGVTIALAEVGLDAMEQFSADGRVTPEARLLIEDQRAALEMVMDLVGGRRALTASYIRELYQGLTEHQDTRDAIDAQGVDSPRRCSRASGSDCRTTPSARTDGSTSTARRSSCRTRSTACSPGTRSTS